MFIIVRPYLFFTSRGKPPILEKKMMQMLPSEQTNAPNQLLFVSAKIQLFFVICKFRTKIFQKHIIIEYFIGKIRQNNKKNAFL